MKLWGNYWLGILLYTIMILLTYEIVRFLLKRTLYKNRTFPHSVQILSGILCLCILLICCAAGTYQARNITVTPYEVTVNKQVKDLDSLHIVLLADIHLGYNTGCSMMEKTVAEINALNPDLVLIAGDIFDNEYEALDDPDRLVTIMQNIKSRYGVFACYGNHDISEEILAGFTFQSDSKKTSDSRMNELLERAGIQLLSDSYVLVDDAFYVYGRPDYSHPEKTGEKRKSPEELMREMDSSKPVLLLDHQPRELNELSAAGVDIDFGGHTHNGQTFPGNLVMPFLWENPCGLVQYGSMYNIVTAGVGVFGPCIRLGVPSEICSIQVNFAK